MTVPTARFWLATLLLAAAAAFLQLHTRGEVFSPRLPLSAFPRQLGGWTGSDVSLPEDVLEVLGPGDFLMRTYQNQEKPGAVVNLFIAYFRSQRTGDTIHSPQNCLPGAGWIPIEFSRIMLTPPGHASFPANRYVVTRGDSRQLVLYWYWAHDRGVASEYWAKLYLVSDSIRMNRSDGALVRLVTPVAAGESDGSAEQRLVPIASDIVPLLGDYIPR